MYVPKETSKIRLFIALCGVSIKKNESKSKHAKV